MEPLGWIIFLTSYTFVIGLVVFCFWRVISVPQEHVISYLDIDTKDTNDEDKEEENL